MSDQCIITAEQYADGHKVHVCYAVLKSRGDESHDGEKYGKYFANHILCSHGYPHGQDDKPVTQYSSKKAELNGKAILAEAIFKAFMPTASLSRPEK